ncbi:MAG: type IV pili twitching motility protein PilT, partial [Ruminococcaceae bacterium]|nr:type IV pili twitching motility protein PilT [Oscillospiraceae bacterium]
MSDLLVHLKNAVDNKSSDIFIIAGSSLCEKNDGHIRKIKDEILLPPATEEMIKEIYSISNRSMDKFLSTGDDDFSFSVPGMARFRVNAFRQRNSMAAVVRIVSFNIPDWQELNIPTQVMDVSGITNGMILFTGTAGSGKSTTQACIIDKINNERDCHIITLEDPIEYLHKNKKSIISQREISIDTADYLSAL